uniref:Myb-like domain-containing protein n=2 Tax=Lutzomyia longipalpis TaxID=7200 RepID=A0A1B0CLB2_LUTLO
MEKKSVCAPKERKSQRFRQIRPIFHAKTKNEDDDILTKALIKQTWKTGVLNLSGKGLAHVPENVWNIPGSINFEDDDETRYCMDKRKSEEEEWWNRQNLVELNLSSNSIATISTNIQKLEDLSILNLSNNLLTQLPAEIGFLRKLTHLNLNSNKLAKLPVDFFKLQDLRVLDLSHNNFDDIHADLVDLVMLENLDLSHNNLKSLPSGIGFLVRLTSLNISFNHIKELPNDILNVMNNDLQNLPEFMGELRKMEILYSQNNNITEIPNLVGCNALKEIQLGCNSIEAISDEFCQSLPQLKVLNLKDNKLKEISKEIVLLRSLSTLDVSNNLLEQLPSTLSMLSHLTNLQVEGNPLKTIRRDIVQCGTARILKILRNERVSEASTAKIEEICDNFPDKYEMKRHRTLNLSLKELVDVPEEVFRDAVEADVSCINLSRNKLTTIPEGFKVMNSVATELDLSVNFLKDVPDFLSQFTHICYLNLSNNLLESLPDSLGLLNTIREINIASNKLRILPNCLYQMTNLEILQASGNQIEAIDASDEGLGALKKLAQLDLSNNSIEVLPPILGNLKQIKNLQVIGNKFRHPRHQILMKGTHSILSYLRDRISDRMSFRRPRVKASANLVLKRPCKSQKKSEKSEAGEDENAALQEEEAEKDTKKPQKEVTPAKDKKEEDDTPLVKQNIKTEPVVKRDPSPVREIEEERTEKEQDEVFKSPDPIAVVLRTDGTSEGDREVPIGSLSPTKMRQRIKPTPFFGSLRRNSTHESEDEGRRQRGSVPPESPSAAPPQTPQMPRVAFPGAVNQRIRTESTCSTVSDVSQARDKHNRRSHRAEEPLKVNELKREISHRMASGKFSDRSRLTMYDMIYYNPSSNPMKYPAKKDKSKATPERRSSVSSVISVVSQKSLKSENENNPEKEKPPPEEEVKVKEETAMPVPQLKLGPNGEMILDEKSLVIETTGDREARETLANANWTDSETIIFYKCLHTIGTDFSLMCTLFTNRTRRDLKLKFKKEEKMNLALVNKALMYPKTFDLEELRMELQKKILSKRSSRKRLSSRSEGGGEKKSMKLDVTEEIPEVEEEETEVILEKEKGEEENAEQEVVLEEAVSPEDEIQEQFEEDEEELVEEKPIEGDPVKEEQMESPKNNLENLDLNNLVIVGEEENGETVYKIHLKDPNTSKISEQPLDLPQEIINCIVSAHLAAQTG